LLSDHREFGSPPPRLLGFGDLEVKAMPSDVVEIADPKLARQIKQRERRTVPLHAEAAIVTKDTPERIETRIRSL